MIQKLEPDGSEENKISSGQVAGRFRLFHGDGLTLDAGLSILGATQQFIIDTEANLESTSYLEVGDEVQTRDQHLGRQRWLVIEDYDDSVYGINGPGSC